MHKTNCVVHKLLYCINIKYANNIPMMEIKVHAVFRCSKEKQQKKVLNSDSHAERILPGIL